MKNSDEGESANHSQLSFELDGQRKGKALTNEPGLRVGPVLERVLTTAGTAGRGRRPPVRIVCTGFSSLAYLADRSEMLAHASELGPVDIVLGWEDLAENSFAISKRIHRTLEAAVRDYWLKRGLAARQYPGVLRLMQLVESGSLRFFSLSRMHAKLGVGPEEAIIGSSNFSYGGMEHQLEGNILHKRGIDQTYEELYDIALRFRSKAVQATDMILDLLRRLVRLVGWQEVIAKAASTVLDAEWVSEFEDLLLASREAKLWPSQRQTVVQALYILENNDCVLVADPTGSGKTRALSALHTAQVLRNWDTEFPQRQRAAVLTPPAVEDGWWRELRRYHSQITPEVVSHGLLSNAGTEESRSYVDGALEESNILYVDEAHNLYNDSKRSRRVLGSPATRRVLATATPISRNLDDIQPLIELLDPNNLPDEVINLFDSLPRGRGLSRLEQADKKVLTEAISAVTVRHTISGLNAMIDVAPEEYTDDNNTPCRYPEIENEVYELNETDRDRRIGAEIEELAAELAGIVGLPREASRLNGGAFWGLERSDTPIERAVEGRINALAGLARFNVRAALRSSVPRMVELIEGRRQAAVEFGLGLPSSGGPSDQGEASVMAALDRWREAGVPSIHEKAEPWVPDWLRDPLRFTQVVDAEKERYKRIMALSRMLSPARLEARVQEMSRLINTYGKVLVFDDSIVTLSLLRRVAGERGLPVVPLFEGASNPEKRAEALFGLNSNDDVAIGLCSPRLSEGVNLQGAQALMFSHIPQVYRHAEQRIGRIVRMNSRFTSVYVSWPEDAPEFQLSTDKQLYETAGDVEDVLGANVGPPLQLAGRDKEQRYSGSTASKTFVAQRRKAESNQMIHDAFDPLRQLVSGKEAIVDPDIYESVRGTEAPVAAALRPARVGTIRASTPFVFATVVRENRAPEFFFWSKETDQVLSRDLSEIAQRLREVVSESKDPADRALAFEEAKPFIEKAFARFQRKRRSLLPNRHQRALDALAHLAHWIYKHRRSLNVGREAIDRLQQLAEIARDGRYVDQEVNLKRFAEALIENVFEPLRRETIRASKRRKRRIITYKRALATLKNGIKQGDRVFPTDEILNQLEASLEPETSIEQQTVALLVGVDTVESS